MVKAITNPGINKATLGVKAVEERVNHDVKSDSRLYRISRRLGARVTELERKVSTLITTVNRLQQQNYRVLQKTKEELPRVGRESSNVDTEALSILFGEEIKHG
jgi:TolA-binding protein